MLVNLLILVLTLYFDFIYSQAPTAQYCTLPNLCRDGNIIDPRISNAGTNGDAPAPPSGLAPTFLAGNTPGVGIVSSTSCPSGYVLCTNISCGTPSTQPGTQDGFATQSSFPWHVFLRNNNNLANKNGYAGGGVLLDPVTVLTAAHKVSNLTSISIVVGVYNIASSTNTQTAQVSAVWIHSNYNQDYLKNDIAILKLSSPVLINTDSMPICLPPAGSTYIGSPSTSCLVSGWGQTNFNVDDAPTQNLRQVHVPIVTNDNCMSSYSNVLGAANAAAYLDFPNEFCAGGQAQMDACTQDGGSPLVCGGTAGQFNLVGLVLWGKNCGQAGRYGVYLSVPAYLNWVQCTRQCFQTSQSCTNCPAIKFL